jgi:predicted enzyme related to lactoylglutathione lyase
VKEIAMANPFVHVELHTKDLPKARQFYQSLFSWELTDTPMPGGSGSYTMIGVGEGVGGGMMADASVAPHWLAYVGVEDVREKTAQAKSLGATVLQDVMEVGEYGTMSVIRDPSGAVLALWQGKAQG